MVVLAEVSYSNVKNMPYRKLNYPELNLARSCLPLYRWQKVKQTRQVIFSVGPKLKIPKEQILLFCGTDNFEQSRFQSIKVPIPKLEVPPDLQS